jgi:hypothetical protein
MGSSRYCWTGIDRKREALYPTRRYGSRGQVTHPIAQGLEKRLNIKCQSSKLKVQMTKLKKKKVLALSYFGIHLAFGF